MSESDLFSSVPYEGRLRKNSKHEDTGQDRGFNVSKKSQILNKWKRPQGNFL